MNDLVNDNQLLKYIETLNKIELFILVIIVNLHIIMNT